MVAGNREEEKTRDTDLGDSRIWLLEIGKRRKPEIPA